MCGGDGVGGGGNGSGDCGDDEDGDGGNGSGDCGDGAGDDGGKATATAAMAKAAMAKATMASKCGFLGLVNNGMFHFWVLCWSTTLSGVVGSARNGNKLRQPRNDEVRNTP